MAEEKQQSWFQTLPGVITAITGLIVAVGGLIAALNQAGFFSKKADATSGTPVAVVHDVEGANAAIEKHPTAAIKPSVAGADKPQGETAGTLAAVSNDVEHAAANAMEPKQIVQALEKLNVGASVSPEQLLDWLDDDDRTYRRVATVTLDLLDGRRLPGKAPDIDVIKYYYLSFTQRDGDGLIPLGERLDRNAMRRAIVAAFNDKNGGQVKQFERLVAVH